MKIFAEKKEKKWADSFDPSEFEIIECEKQQEGTVRVMSFNLRCSDVNGVYPEDRVEGVVGEVAKIAPDSLGVQEATPFWMKVLNERISSEYAFAGVGRETGGFGDDAGEYSAVFFRKDRFELLDSGNFWLSRTPDKPSKYEGAACTRICTWALLKDKSSGKVFLHANTHLDHISEEARDFGVKTIIDFIKENHPSENVILTGDFNSFDTQIAYKTLSEQFRDASEAAERTKGRVTFHGGKPKKIGERIDYIFCSDGVSVKDFRTVTDGIDGRFSSDHFPLYADVVFKG